MTGSWPLIGRAAELARIGELARGEGPDGVVLAGVAGVGKKRLAREALAAASRAGSASAWAVATRSAAVIPFGALSHLLPASTPRASQRLDVLRAAVAHLTQRPEGGRPLSAIDDAHLLDDASATLVRQLVETAAAFVVMTRHGAWRGARRATLRF